MTPTFRERVGWPMWLWGFLLFLIGSVSLAFWAATGTYSAELSFAVQLLILLVGAIKTPLEVKVDENWLYVGRAKIEKKFIESVAVLSPSQIRDVRGPKADPRAFLAIRFWINRGVKVVIKDEQDSTPYWLISSKNADQLAHSLLH